MFHSKQLSNNRNSMFFEDESQENDYRIFELDTILKRKIWRT